MVLSLIQNVALLVALAAFEQFIVRRWKVGALPHTVLSGLLFGGATILGMMTRVQAAPGVFYDGRSIVLGVAGLFGGPVVAIIAAAIAAAYRLYLGGAGALVGVGVIVEASAIGVGLHYLRRRDERVTGWLPLWIFALTIHVLMLLIQLALPGGIAPAVLRQIAIPVLVVYPIGTLLVCRLMLDQEERLASERRVRDMNESLERLVMERTTELMAANEQLGYVNDDLEHALEVLREANEAKSAFLRAMSHELRTPLNSIIGFSKILASGLGGPVTNEQLRQLEMINASGHHLLALVNDLLDLARIEAGKLEVNLEDIDAAEIVREIADSGTPEAEEKGLILRAEVPDGPVLLHSDPLRIRQILINLLGNAIKFTQTGTVTLRLTRSAPGLVEFSVIDTGPGVPGDLRDDVFVEFVQGAAGDSPRVGVGLGLAISRGLAHLLGGMLILESTDDRGSTFTLRLPVDIDAA